MDSSELTTLMEVGYERDHGYVAIEVDDSTETCLLNVTFGGITYWDVDSPWSTPYVSDVRSEQCAREVFTTEKARIQANLDDHGDGWDKKDV